AERVGLWHGRGGAGDGAAAPSTTRATGPTRIDDFVEAMRVITPQGPVESLRVPGSGAGPSTDRLFLGSEGTLGVIVEAWLRVTDRPARKASASVAFAVYDQ